VPVQVAGRRGGVVLLVTLVLLIVLCWLGYRISSRVAALRHRSQYAIDYQKARYARDSALKYALATLEDVNEVLVSRPNEPDFSDLFAMSEPDYDLLLQQWAEQLAAEGRAFGLPVETAEWPPDDNDTPYLGEFGDLDVLGDGLYSDDLNEPNLAYEAAQGPNDLVIRGPYGPQWPLVAEPARFKVGTAEVTMSIEDENAKFPVCWATITDSGAARGAEASLAVFCEWMGITGDELDQLRAQFDEVAEIRSFKVPTGSETAKDAAPRAAAKVRSSRASRTGRRVRGQATAAETADRRRDFAKLFHSSLVDVERFSLPTIESSTREESALKYMGLWGSGRVNINTAPRHVLEAAFAFGGDEVEIAEAIIQQRRVQPFNDITDLKKALLRYSGSIDRCEKYITAKSDFFTVRITAESGRARASAVMAMARDGQKVEKIGVIAN
jgi:type II secretory pathway component PulK